MHGQLERDGTVGSKRELRGDVQHETLRSRFRAESIGPGRSGAGLGKSAIGSRVDRAKHDEPARDQRNKRPTHCAHWYRLPILTVVGAGNHLA
jgi:hypothetical protein